MKKKIANSTCVVCHSIMPRTEMRQVRITEKTGKSGRSTTLRPSKKDGQLRVSVNSGRNYYRNRKVWVCKTCKGPKSLSAGSQETLGALKSLILWLIIIYFVLVVFGYKDNYQKTTELIPDKESLSEIFSIF